MRHIINSLYITFGAVLLLGGAHYASAWTAPISAAPNNNSSAPLNISATNQSKLGNIGLGGLLVSGNSIFSNGVKITSGSPGLGKVLVSDDEGNASWKTFSEIIEQIKVQKVLDVCPTGSAKMTIAGKTFCGYERTTGGVGYCDKFGQEYDKQVACYDIGHGRNHGINAYPQGCQAWEGDENYGGQGALFYCEKKKYTPKTAEDCTASGAALGSINEPLFSTNPIVTCGIYSPYTFYYCEKHESDFLGKIMGRSTATLSGTSCKAFLASKTYPATLGHATTTSCPSGWVDYMGTCI